MPQGSHDLGSLRDYQPISYYTDVGNEDYGIYEKALQNIRESDGLVSLDFVDALHSRLAAVYTFAKLGQPHFIFQAGPCAETFEFANSEAIISMLSLFEAVTNLICMNMRITPDKVVAIGRFAGQYAKPRSCLNEIIAKEELNNNSSLIYPSVESPLSSQSFNNRFIFDSPVNTVHIQSYRGDLVNGYKYCERTPDPSRLLQAYMFSKLTLSSIFNYTSLNQSDILPVIFTSHEALCLPYESALLRKATSLSFSTHATSLYSSSAAFLWLGDRTSFPDSIHTHFLKNISNPIGIKISPFKSPATLVELLDIINPYKIVGRITLITRLGKDNVSSCLPPFIDAVRKSCHPVIWLCDPMHGNTTTVYAEAENGNSVVPKKSRYFSSILQEWKDTVATHLAMGSICSGVHLEISEDILVTECIGGLSDPIVRIDNLLTRYTTTCDPRLNPLQTLDLFQAFFQK